ncbi:metallophosphoesterase [Rhodopirellula sp. P2]|uniref:metallophosphoesterase n=1 Tax=Rhodopirellula sp. P2 TaxID=2127060 RepID=UPI0030842CE8
MYDIIGDTHGHADELKALLSDLRYSSRRRGYRHPDRKAVFVGDFVDRGSAIGEVVEIARAMVDAGDALAVMGNHECNAIAFHTPRPGKPWSGKTSEWFPAHADRNFKQHQATLDQLSPANSPTRSPGSKRFRLRLRSVGSVWLTLRGRNGTSTVSTKRWPTRADSRPTFLPCRKTPAAN